MVITLRINGEVKKVEVKPNETLLDVLREKLEILGPKLGCGNGECGACTVIYNGRPVNSCLVLAPEADGAEILTVEGITGENGELHPIQKAFVEESAFQCGFCTPGFITSTYALLQRKKDVTDEDIVEALSGNLCRCTGYESIVRAVKKAAKELKEEEGVKS